MKSTLFSLLLLVILAIGCSQSSSSDPDPTPKPPDYSSCRYTLSYSLRYSLLSSAKPTTLSYLDSTQKMRTVMLKDTSFDLTVTYKYGDSMYLALTAPYIYFANKTGNKFSRTYSTKGTGSVACPIAVNSGSISLSGITRDSLPAAASINPLRIK